MWMLDNRTPFSAERAFLRDMHGAENWIVAVKGTFTVTPDGETELAGEQAAVLRAAEYFGEPGQSSLLLDTDLVLEKPTTDVVLHGQAYAPGRREATEVVVSMAVGPLRKSLRIIGDRQWIGGLGGLELTAPQPFEQKPIRYERSLGGKDRKPDEVEALDSERRNPVGTGFTATGKPYVGLRAPNVLPLDQPDVPIGFGPIPVEWSPRTELAGTFDDSWQKERFPLLPLDFNERFYQCAPPDQQTPAPLEGGEPVRLENLTSGRLLEFQLPRVSLVFRTDFGGEQQEHRARLHTVILEPDFPRVQLVWHTRLACHHKVHRLRQTTIEEEG